MKQEIFDGGSNVVQFKRQLDHLIKMGYVIDSTVCQTDNQNGWYTIIAHKPGNVGTIERERMAAEKVFENYFNVVASDPHVLEYLDRNHPLTNKI